MEPWIVMVILGQICHRVESFKVDFLGGLSILDRLIGTPDAVRAAVDGTGRPLRHSVYAHGVTMHHQNMQTQLSMRCLQATPSLPSRMLADWGNGGYIGKIETILRGDGTPCDAQRGRTGCKARGFCETGDDARPTAVCPDVSAVACWRPS